MIYILTSSKITNSLCCLSLPISCQHSPRPFFMGCFDIRGRPLWRTVTSNQSIPEGQTVRYMPVFSGLACARVTKPGTVCVRQTFYRWRRSPEDAVFSEVTVKTLRPADIAVGCFLALLGLLILYAATTIRVGVEGRCLPAPFPLSSDISSCFAASDSPSNPGVSGERTSKLNWPDREGLKIILVNLVSLAFYIVLMNPLGLPLSTFLYVAFSTWYLKPSKWITAIVIGLIFGIVSYYVFISLLGLSFPEGLPV